MLSRAMAKVCRNLVERLGTLGPQRIAVEATGGFETVVAAALAGASLPVVVVNPAQVRAFAQALGLRRAKPIRSPDKCEHDRPLRRGDQAGLAAARSRRSDPTARRPRRAGAARSLK